MMTCRLCDGAVEDAFSKQVLNRYDVKYFECLNCHSLQTENPHWLEAAYADGNLALADTGPAVRSLNSQAVVWAAARILRFPLHASILDYGGGSGLLCRLLRDQGFDARLFDAYAENDLARGFEDNGSTPDILCSFEVAEHFAEPKRDMARLFERGAKLLVIGTETYRGQDQDWWYISPEAGQHVFFYSSDGMRILASSYNYHYERFGSLHFFLARPMTRLEGAVLWRTVSSFGLRVVRGYLGYRMSGSHASTDSRLLHTNQSR